MTAQWPGLLISAAKIASYCGVSQRTIRRWREHHGLPLCHLPDGRLAISQNLVDQWLEGIIEKESYQPWGARWKRQEHTAKGKRRRWREIESGGGEAESPRDDGGDTLTARQLTPQRALWTAHPRNMRRTQA